MFDSDRLRAAIEAVVRTMVPSSVYLAAWPAVVVSWDDDAQLAELALIGGGPLPGAMRGVPVLVDPPGTRVQLLPGTQVLVMFAGGDAAKPYFRPATAFGAPAFVPQSIGLANGGPTQGVARLGDSVGPFLITSASSIVRSG